MHEYTVELRIHGSDLDLSSVTDSLNIKPSMTRSVGDSKTGARSQEAMWSYNGFPESVGSKSWSSLEEGLAFVLDRLWSVRDKIKSINSRYRVILWCGHFQSSFDGGPILSAEILQKLGDFGVDLFIDNYCSNEPESLEV